LIRSLSYRAHSRKELEDKLRQKGFTEEERDYAISRAARLELIDDGEYAAGLASSLLKYKGFAPSRIRLELMGRGIDRDLIDAALEKLESDPAERAAELLGTKFASYTYEKAFSALTRLGYDADDIKHALRETGVDFND